MYNRYQGNSGRVRRMEEPPARRSGQEPGHQPSREGTSRQPRPVPGPPPGQRRPLSPLSGLSGELGRLLGRFTLSELETEDILIILILYLLYKETGDDEFLFIIGAMFFL